jgi:D-arabinose 1-dehydrogenase-like Zn-dependent alcohol dehydrogenase
MKLVEEGKITPVIYNEAYRGLGDLPRAMEDLKERRVYGRAVLRIDEEAEKEKEGGGRARL